MTFRATNVTPESAYRTVRTVAAQMKVNIASMQARLAAQNADYEYLRSIYSLLQNGSNQFSDLKTTPGLAAYAKTAEDDPAYDVSAEFQEVQSAISTALVWMDDNIPTSATAKAPSDWGEGTIISNTLTPTETEGLRSMLKAVGATIS
jgi:hypothetical protein